MHDFYFETFDSTESCFIFAMIEYDVSWIDEWDKTLRLSSLNPCSTALVSHDLI